MLTQLSRRFNRLEQQKTDLLDQLARLSLPQLRYRASPSAWSALEMLDHLILTEAAIVDTMLRSLPHRHPVSAAERVRGRLLEWLFLTPVRVKVPQEVTHLQPRSELSLAAQAASWSFLRSRMADTLQHLPAQAVRGGAFRHSVSGRMDVLQTLRFLSAHMVHHGYQLRRIKRIALRSAPAESDRLAA